MNHAALAANIANLQSQADTIAFMASLAEQVPDLDLRYTALIQIRTRAISLRHTLDQIRALADEPLRAASHGERSEKRAESNPPGATRATPALLPSVVNPDAACS